MSCGKINRGWFRPGHDARRHVLTKEECRRGGETRWLQVMAELRLAMGLSLPHPKLRELALDLLRKRGAAV